MRIFRLLKIQSVAFRFGLDEFFLSHGRLRILRAPIKWLTFWRNLDRSRGERLRMAMETLGPIFIKFGQMLSTRRDLLPQDIADELAKLQDQVPPFSTKIAIETLEKVYNKKVDEIFLSFDEKPIASASVAQVHFAVLHDGTEVAVKILRPSIAPIIAHDIALMDTGAWLAESLWPDGKRLKLQQVVSEFS
ncbi:MAG: AarF/UbiB family protein, partial [Nitrosomonas sp.]|nr:AarF/UbiB family protein [Nitrosomonas sp.]